MLIVNCDSNKIKELGDQNKRKRRVNVETASYGSPAPFREVKGGLT